MRYELYYHASNPGRGEFVRLALEEAGADYIDVARESGPGLGPEALARVMKESTHPPFAPPFLKAGELVIGQTANILLFLGPRLGLVAEGEACRYWAHQLQLTVSDLLKEIQDTHHPIAHGLYYDEQKPEAIRHTHHFLAERLPKYMGYFERVLTENGGAYIVGSSLSYVDLSMFQLIEALRFAFPSGLGGLNPRVPNLITLHGRVAARPNVAAYLKSPRRMAFNDRGISRYYPELDEA